VTLADKFDEELNKKKQRGGKVEPKRQGDSVGKLKSREAESIVTAW